MAQVGLNDLALLVQIVNFSTGCLDFTQEQLEKSTFPPAAGTGQQNFFSRLQLDGRVSQGETVKVNG